MKLVHTTKLLKHLNHTSCPLLEPWNEASQHTCAGSANWTEVHSLQPAALYHLRLLAVNAIGRSTPTAPVAVNTREEAPGGAPVDVMGFANGSQAIVVNWKVRWRSENQDHRCTLGNG